MAKKKNKKVIRYRRPLNINVGMIIFAIIFVYLMFSATTYLNREKIQFYEVADGGIVNTRIYTGLILREEQVRNAERSGYINDYLPEGKRASVGSRIYTLDESGTLDTLLKENAEEGQALSDESLRDLRAQLNSMIMALDDENFGRIYDYRYSLESAVMEYSSFSAMDQLDALAAQAGAAFQQVRSDVSGVVSYSFDSFETMRPEEVEAASFDQSAYSRTRRKSGDLIESGSPAYKIVTSENWSIVFPLNEEDLELFRQEDSLRIIFRDASLELSCPFSVIMGADGGSYGRLDFSKYMVEFIGDRFVELEVKLDQADGLKIPISAVTEKDFFLVPLDYLEQGGDSSDTGFLKEVYDENGTSVVFVPTTLYYADESYYYIDTDEEEGFKAGDYIVKPESSERYQIGPTGSLQGVYNINRGYTVFKQIEILDSNSEYYTVRRNMDYGLSVYDHIVLDAPLVEGGQRLYH